MPREQLRALARDVDRLLLAGSAAAATDEGLRRRARALRELGQKAPVLAKIADAADRVLAAGPAKAAAALLDLLLVLRQVRAGLATAGVEGPLEPIEPSGPWISDSTARDVYPLLEGVTRAPAERRESFTQALERGVVNDLRFIGALCQSFSRPMAETLAEMGPDAAPAIPLLLALLKSPNKVARIGAAQVLAQIGPAAQAALPALTQLLRTEKQDADLCAAVTAARSSIQGQR
jgi:hypothetical protein